MDVKPGYKQTDVGMIPKNWESMTVRDIASPVRNAIVGGPFGSDLVSNDYVGDGVPVVRGQNMGSKFVEGNFAFVTRAKAKSLEANLARPGDLVFTQRGTLGQVSLVPDRPYDCYVVSQSQMKLTVNRTTAEPLFFYYVFSGSAQQGFIRQNTIQTGVPHINLGILRAIPVQRPSLAEQEAIAEALSDADALIESCEQLLAKKRHIKQGAMKELLTGKKRLPGFNGEWEVKRLGDLGFTFGGLTNKSKSDFGDGKSRYITFMNIMTNVVIDLGMFEQVKVLSAETQNRVTKGDLFFNGSSETPEEVGMCAVLAEDVQDVYLNSFCFGFRFREGSKADGLYLAYYFRSREGRELLKSLAQGATRYNLSKTALLRVAFLLPPTPEQTAIAAILSDMDAEIAALVAKLAKARGLKQGMMQELLTGSIRLV